MVDWGDSDVDGRLTEIHRCLQVSNTIVNMKTGHLRPCIIFVVNVDVLQSVIGFSQTL